MSDPQKPAYAKSERFNADLPARIARAAMTRKSANRIRSEPAACKRALAGGPSAASFRRAAELLAAPPDWAHGWAVGEMLSAVRGLGRVRLERSLEAAGLQERTALGEIAPEARSALDAWLRERAERYGAMAGQ